MQDYLKKNVIGIIDKLTLDLLINKPDDVVGYMKKWIQTKGQDIHKEYQRKMKNRPDGVETSESSEQSEDELFDLPSKIKANKRTNRKSVSAEVYGVYNPKGDFKPPFYQKPESEK